MECSRAAVTQRLLEAGIESGRVVGATPIASHERGRCTRAFEIMSWLSAHGGASSCRFVVLDDCEVHGEGLPAPYVLRIDSSQALTAQVFPCIMHLFSKTRYLLVFIWCLHR